MERNREFLQFVFFEIFKGSQFQITIQIWPQKRNILHNETTVVTGIIAVIDLAALAKNCGRLVTGITHFFVWR